MSTINNIIKPTLSSRNGNINEISSNGTVITESIQIANEINNYYVNVGRNIADSFTDVADYRNYLRGYYPDSFILLPVTDQDVIDVINSLKNKRCDTSMLPARVLKSISQIISPILKALVNLSFSTGIFSDYFKIARVVPLFKGGDKTAVGNYRPISTLHIFSKIFEKIVHRQLATYLESKNILSDCQYGIRVNR